MLLMYMYMDYYYYFNQNVPFQEPYVLLMRNHVRDRMQEITEYISETDFYIRLDKWQCSFS